MAPVRPIPALRINIAITVIVAELLKPLILSSGVTKPKIVRSSVVIMATMSDGNHSATNKINAKTTMASVRSIVMYLLSYSAFIRYYLFH